MRARLIYNRKAGGGHHEVTPIVAALEKAGFEVLYTPDARREHIGEFAREPVAVVVAAGGDGTVARAGRALVGHAPGLAVLPLGTANNIARSLGITGDPLALAERLARPRKARLDVGLATGPWGRAHFIEACGVGLFQHFLEHDASSKDKDLARARGLVLAKLEAGLAPTRWELTIDGAPRACDLLLLEIMLGQSIGPRLRFAPRADPFDGLFDIVLAHAKDRPKIVRYLKALLAGDDDASPDLEVLQARSVDVRLAGCSLRVDDNLVRESGPAPIVATPSRFEIMPGAIELWLPGALP